MSKSQMAVKTSGLANHDFAQDKFSSNTELAAEKNTNLLVRFLRFECLSAPVSKQTVFLRQWKHENLILSNEFIKVEFPP